MAQCVWVGRGLIVLGAEQGLNDRFWMRVAPLLPALGQPQCLAGRGEDS
jgi:hypothetical protein